MKLLFFLIGLTIIIFVYVIYKIVGNKTETLRPNANALTKAQLEKIKAEIDVIKACDKIEDLAENAKKRLNNFKH